MFSRSTLTTFAFTISVLLFAMLSLAQQKGQYVPGQFGPNSGVIPDRGFTYANITVNYSASQLNNSSGNSIPGITGTYGFRVTENIFYYVPNSKALCGHFAPFVIVPFANGSLVADGPLGIAWFGINAGAEGLAEWVQPINFGWHFRRTSFTAGYAFVAPTGRFRQSHEHCRFRLLGITGAASPVKSDGCWQFW
jgi:hypothetical protein